MDSVVPSITLLGLISSCFGGRGPSSFPGKEDWDASSNTQTPDSYSLLGMGITGIGLISSCLGKTDTPPPKPSKRKVYRDSSDHEEENRQRGLARSLLETAI